MPDDSEPPDASAGAEKTGTATLAGTTLSTGVNGLPAVLAVAVIFVVLSVLQLASVYSASVEAARSGCRPVQTSATVAGVVV